jgi:hypothetical protein
VKQFVAGVVLGVLLTTAVAGAQDEPGRFVQILERAVAALDRIARADESQSRSLQALERACSR